MPILGPDVKYLFFPTEPLILFLGFPTSVLAPLSETPVSV